MNEQLVLTDVHHLVNGILVQSFVAKTRRAAQS